MVRNADWFEEQNSNEPNDLQAWRRDLLPWADPYIAALIASLEREDLTAEFDGA
jgi:hypothetical protein